jgi:hypothetical protein
MSSKQRRANVPQQQPVVSSPPAQVNRPVDMTLPQVLQLLETRLRKLEQVKPVPVAVEETKSSVFENVISSLQTEYDSRFNMLVTEINQMKDIVMKLQAYTMDVNKTLLEERVHFMADMSDVKENIVMREKTDEEEDA